MITLKITVEDDDGLEAEHALPAHYEVCQTCGGEGSHVDPNIDGNGITASEWAEWDDENRVAYMRGDYDVTCEECNGARVVPVADVDRMTEEQKVAYERWERGQAAAARESYEDAHTRRMESGGW